MMHLAAAVGTAVVGLWGKTDPIFWKPQAENLAHIIDNKKSCTSIGATRVTAAAEEFLKNTRSAFLTYRTIMIFQNEP